MSEMMWRPDAQRICESSMFAFMDFVETQTGQNFNNDVVKFHRFSVEQAEKFWKLLIEFLPFHVEGNLNPVCEDWGFESYGWFPGLKLNYAKNLLEGGLDEDMAIVAIHESLERREISFRDLRLQVGQLMQALSPFQSENTVIGAYMPNIPETVLAMLGASGLGMTFTSTSPDFGVEGVSDRFGQSKPKLVFCVSSYLYNGKLIDMRPKLRELAARLPEVQRFVIVNFTGDDFDISDIPRSITFEDFIAVHEECEPSFELFPFSHPLYIMYSSGTTGRPKCIVHGAGGTLLNLAKELILHLDVKQDDKVLYFTTCGWMMWNWLASTLFTGATTYLYEGAPGHPTLSDFVGHIDRERITHFGTSPKFLKALEESGYNQKYDLDNLRTLLSTGSPLLPEQYDFIYQKLKNDLQVASISGGTDIIGCFMLGHPMRPVYKGEIQSLGLGLDVAAFNDQGEGVYDQEGELVCRKSFPNRPLHFLEDTGAQKMKEAYFNQFKGVWHHGDFVSITSEGGVIVYGRSDATLNPGGVRIGTSEIYRQTESLPYIEDSLCVGADRDGDVDVILYVLLKQDEMLTQERVAEIKGLIKKNTTPRHVPSEVYAVKGIPYTRSGKKMELAVARLINGKPLTNIEAVANPECLGEYQVLK